MSFILKAARAACCGAAVIASPAFAALGLDVVPGGGSAGVDDRAFTLGWSFEVASAIAVNQLGLWDQGADGLGASHLVRLWASDQTLLASATIDNGDGPQASALSEGRWLMESFSAIVLLPGTYVIGADGAAGDWVRDPFRFNGQSISTVPEVNYGQSLFSSTLGFPFSHDSSGDRGYQGPTFGITTPVPEPGSHALMIAGLLGLFAARRKLAV